MWRPYLAAYGIIEENHQRSIMALKIIKGSVAASMKTCAAYGGGIIGGIRRIKGNRLLQWHHQASRIGGRHGKNDYGRRIRRERKNEVINQNKSAAGQEGVGANREDIVTSAA